MGELEPLVAYRLDVSPGDGTRYDLVITEDPRGGLLVSWPDMGAFWWASTEAGGEVQLRGSSAERHKSRGRRWSKGLRYDTTTIGELLDDAGVRPWKRPRRYLVREVLGLAGEVKLESTSSAPITGEELPAGAIVKISGVPRG